MSFMDDSAKNVEKNFDKLEAVVYNTVAKINSLKRINKNLKGEVNELKRLKALSEKKAERLKQELGKVSLTDQQLLQEKEKDIKKRLKSLSAKISVFEKNYTMDS